MNYIKTFSMKSFICIIAMALTFSISFANETKKINTHNLTSSSLFKNLKNEVALTLEYEATSFCVNKPGVSTPKVSEVGGTFSYTRVSNGTGGLGFNNTTGKIDHNSSDLGTYKITYQKGQSTATVLITVNQCN